MKARLVPVYFPGRDEDFDKQLDILKLCWLVKLKY
jgi:hypothetical protein